MTKQNILSPERVSGIIIAALGVVALLAAFRYGIGSLSNIGPGALPAVVAAVLIICGAGMAVAGGPVSSLQISGRPVFFVLVSIAAWAIVTLWFGLIAGTIALVLLATLALERAKWRAAILTAAALAVFGSVLFVRLLGMPLQIISWF